ncbi:hypothetical protein OUZ56_008550 [Daphnia magna]|uniref:Uncharacterized protein n=1 Tax=Daphnia magna TaxID=35525 RepID=A0ABR0ADB6_9CRUS|nr:hypothetical protein OUZ56_008550 [Daphnia magna]
MCFSVSAFVQEPLVRTPLQHAPQPVIEASEKISKSGTCGKNTLSLPRLKLLDHHSRSDLASADSGHLTCRLNLARLACSMYSACILRKCACANGIVGIAHVKLPIIDAISRNVIEPLARAASHLVLTADAFSVGSANDNLIELITSPRYSSIWAGSVIDFSQFIKNQDRPPLLSESSKNTLVRALIRKPDS